MPLSSGLARRHRWGQNGQGGFAMKLLTCAAVLTSAVCSSYAFAQAPMSHAGANMSDEELIKLAISAPPEAVTKEPTAILVGPEGHTRKLRHRGAQYTAHPRPHAAPSPF